VRSSSAGPKLEVAHFPISALVHSFPHTILGPERRIFLDPCSVLTLEPHELEKAAKEKLSLNGWNYAASNAGEGLTDRANREAFYRHRIIPRMLRDTNCRDTTTELFGHKINAPIVFSPIGVNKIYHPDGELAVAKVAGTHPVPLPFFKPLANDE